MIIKKALTPLFTGILLAISSCDQQAAPVRTTQTPPMQAKGLKTQRFRTMDLSACDCMSLSYFGQTMRDNYAYMIAGGGTGGDNVLATTSALSSEARAIALDADDNVFIADYAAHKIRMVPRTSGTYFGQSMTANYIYTIAGDGTFGTPTYGSLATSSSLGYPRSITIDSHGNVIFSGGDYNHRVNMIPKTNGTYYGIPMTANNLYAVAGSASVGYHSDGDLAATANLQYNTTVDVDSQDNLFLNEFHNNCIDMVPVSSATYYGISMIANHIYTIAGDHVDRFAGDGGVATSASLFHPEGIHLDDNDNLFIADGYNHRIRMVPRANGANFGQSMSASYMYTVAGNGNAAYGGDGYLASYSSIYAPTHITTDADNNLYIADTSNGRVRMIPRTSGSHFAQSMTANYIYTIAGHGGASMNGSNALAINLQVLGVAVDSAKNLFVSGPGAVGMIPVCNQ
jgi:hypothetical protein